MANADFAEWHRIRADFEGLPLGEWILEWASHPLESFSGLQLPSHWSWFYPSDRGLRARASAIFTKAAKARGYDHEDKWLDELRYSDFTEFKISGSGGQRMPDGQWSGYVSGTLKNAVSQSITLCHQLEAGTVPTPLIVRLPNDALARLETARTVFMVDFEPKLALEREREANTVSRVRDAELLRDFVIHEFTAAARACMALCASTAEFETELCGEVARFVRFNIRQYDRLNRIRGELENGFALFMMRADPWSSIPESQRPSYSRPGAILAEALQNAASILLGEWTGHASESPKELARPAKRAATFTPPFPNRAAWLAAKLAERGWNEHDLQQYGGPEHRTTQKILNGLNVQDGVLRKVITGLSSKLTHKGLNLAMVAETDIPKG